MTRGILIAGNESALTNAIGIEAAKRVEHYACAIMPDRLSGDSERIGIQTQQRNFSETSGIPLDWNPGSPISARTLVIAAENRLEHIDEAILVCDPPSVRCAAAELNMANVEILVNEYIKSWFFLVKELAAVFRTRGGGTLVLVYPETSGIGGKDDAADILGMAALAAFSSLTRSLLSSTFNEPYITLGFSGADTGDEAGFAAFIFKQIEDGNRRSNGKLHKYGKLSFFR
ncbi:MAG: hypothetical protein LBG95_04510 [Treponema sp.]|jgi:hypothetical protein|nr:hypothetical protein [Treponema sp.]